MFRKILLITIISATLANAQFLGHYQWSADRATSEVIGYSDTYFADASSGNLTIPSTWTEAGRGGVCRGISADSTGLVKIDYLSQSGQTVTEVVMLIGGIIRPVRNVTKIYQYYTGTTAGTAKSFNSSGTAVTNAVKLHR